MASSSFTLLSSNSAWKHISMIITEFYLRCLILLEGIDIHTMMAKRLQLQLQLNWFNIMNLHEQSLS